MYIELVSVSKLFHTCASHKYIDRTPVVHQRSFTSGPALNPTSTARDVSAQVFRLWVAFEYSIFHVHVHANRGGLEPRLSRASNEILKNIQKPTFEGRL